MFMHTVLNSLEKLSKCKMSQSDRVRSFTEVKLPVSWRRANMPLFCFLDTNMIWVHLLFKSINSDGLKKKKKDPKRFGIVSKTVGLKLKEKIHLRNTSLLLESFYFMICCCFFSIILVKTIFFCSHQVSYISQNAFQHASEDAWSYRKG